MSGNYPQKSRVLRIFQEFVQKFEWSFDSIPSFDPIILKVYNLPEVPPEFAQKPVEFREINYLHENFSEFIRKWPVYSRTND